MPNKEDPAHIETEAVLRRMEKQIEEVYRQAYQEAHETAIRYMEQFRKMDKNKRKQVENGELEQEDYNRWRRTQLFQGKRYQEMADTLAADMTHSNEIAASVINRYLPDIYAINHNYGTYEVEHKARINTQYSLYDRQTVERLMRDNPDLLPRRAAINVPTDMQWNKKHVNSAVVQSILQGEDVDQLANRLSSTLADMSYNAAMRSARTMTTSAQNGGRVDSYKRAESMGIKMLQVWLSTLDDTTRHAHRLLDGQKRPVGMPFEIEGMKIDFPGDPKADPSLVYNCRCTLIGEVEGVDYNLSDVTERDSKLGDITYKEWKEDKKELGRNTSKSSQGKATKGDDTKAKVYKKSLDNGDNSSIIKSGAISGAYNSKNDPDNKKREKSAEQYYEEMRNRDKATEVKAISTNSGLSIQEAEMVFNHVFEDEHLFADGTKKRFAPDYYMQQSFMRIREGKNIEQHDRTLLYHELEEAKLMAADPHMTYEEAHEIVQNKYNYKAELKKYLKKKGGKDNVDL